MICPLCKLPARATGRLVAGGDSSGAVCFVFSICVQCTGRLERLPVDIQRRQMAIAANAVADHADRYEVAFFPSLVQAKLYCHLQAEALSAAVR